MRGVSTRRTTPVSEVTHVPTSEQSADVMCVMCVCLLSAVPCGASDLSSRLCPHEAVL